MKRVLLIAVFGTVLAIGRCTIASAGDFATEMVEATYKLFHADSTATCFLVRREPLDETVYLVTAAHVFDGMKKGKTAILVLRERRDDGSYERRDHEVAVRRDGKPLWVRHAAEDIAVLRLAGPLPVPAGAVPMAALADEPRLTAAKLHVCSPLFVLTYPQRFEGTKAGFAVARQGIFASHPLLPVEKNHTYLADFKTFAGDSGGPVFVAGKDDHPLLVGVVLGQYRHDERVTTEYEERTIHHPFGLGIVLHAQFVRDTIEQAAKEAAKPAAGAK